MTDRRPPAAEELLRDLAHPGCPACRIAQRSGDRVLVRLLSESTTDPDTRIRLRAAGGLCPEHASRAEEVAARRVDSRPLGVLAHDLLGRAEEIAGGWWSRRRRPGCQVCEAAGARVDAYLDLLARSRRDSEIGRAVEEPDRGVCSPHLRRGLARVRRPRHVARLRELYRRVAEPLRDELDRHGRALMDADETIDERLSSAVQRGWRWVHGSAPPR